MNRLRRVILGGANINTVDLEGRAPLHFAATEGCVEAATVLLDAGALKDVRDVFGNTPADNARALGHHKLAHFIESYQSLDD